MRTKIILVLILMILAVTIITVSKSRVAFVNNNDEVNVYTNKDFKKSDNLLKNIQDVKIKDKIKDINGKYLIMPNNKDSQFCKMENTVLVSVENNFNVVMVENKDNIDFYTSKGNNCDLVAKMNINGDTKIDNVVYANDSIYANLDSNNNLDLNGMMNLKGDKALSLDTVYKRYKNAVSFDEGVLMIENNKNIVALDEKNEPIFTQNNEKTKREILAINVVDNNLFVIEKNDGNVNLEGYNLNNIESIENADAKIVYPISSLVKNLDFKNQRFSIMNSIEYASFTFGNETLIVNKKMSKLFVLDDIDSVVSFVGDVAIVRNMDNYIALNLKNNESEDIGKLRALSLKIIGSTLYFAILDSESKEVYLKYVVN